MNVQQSQIRELTFYELELDKNDVEDKYDF